jgi:putative copper resistance protein D
MAAAPWAGHSAAIEPWWSALPAHALHLTAAGAWLGALPALLGLLVRDPEKGAEALARFSSLALWLMLGIVLSGVWLALAHVERWPALLGTAYGAVLLAKIALLGGIIALAASLRARLQVRLHTQSFGARAAACLLGVELALAAMLLLLATRLGQTIPARHDAITWLLPFRVSIDATWPAPGVPAMVAGGAVLAALAIAVSAWPTRRGLRVRSATGCALGASGLVLAVRALSVEAYPDTYRRPSVPYHAISVASGEQLFAAHCVECHGGSAHGDGPAAATLALPPADLTEPHTGLHTAGDIFWWLTHGKPPGVMPGLSDRLDEDDRWDLINFVRTLSAGYQARILTERVVPRAPWLPAIDFSYTTDTDESGALKDFRGQRAVLLVFYALPASAPRLAQLDRAYLDLRGAGAETLAIPIGSQPMRIAQRLPTVVEGASETVRTYALLRRTLTNADARDATPVPAHMELLVDRFGYIRARWIAAESGGWAHIEVLLAQLAALAGEPQVRPPPEDHVH